MWELYNTISMDFFYKKIENKGAAAARIGIKGHAPLSQFLNSSFILQLRTPNNSSYGPLNECNSIKKRIKLKYMSIEDSLSNY